MSANTNKLPLVQAEKLARKILDALRPGCQRIEIAGSIRRRKAQIGDIEIVAIEAQGLDEIISGLVDAGKLSRIKNGPKYKQFDVCAVPGLKLDLFLPDEYTWGVIFTIRTGSAEFSHNLVTQKSKGGWLPDDLQVDKGRIRRGDKALDTPEEKDVFGLLGWYVEPEQRTPDFQPQTTERLVLMNHIGQGHLMPGMSLWKLNEILNEAGIANLDSASDEELDRIWQRIQAA